MHKRKPPAPLEGHDGSRDYSGTAIAARTNGLPTLNNGKLTAIGPTFQGHSRGCGGTGALWLYREGPPTMIDPVTGKLGIPETALETCAYLRALGIDDAHPVMNPKTFQRRVRTIITGGAVPSELIRNRRYCSPEVVPAIAAHLGLIVVPPAEAVAA